MNDKQQAVVAAVQARGYHDGCTPAELGAREVMKAIEELAEIAQCITLRPEDEAARAALAALQEAARLADGPSIPGLAVSWPTAGRRARSWPICTWSSATWPTPSRSRPVRLATWTTTH